MGIMEWWNDGMMGKKARGEKQGAGRQKVQKCCGTAVL